MLRTLDADHPHARGRAWVSGRDVKTLHAAPRFSRGQLPQLCRCRPCLVWPYAAPIAPPATDRERNHSAVVGPSSFAAPALGTPVPQRGYCLRASLSELVRGPCLALGRTMRCRSLSGRSFHGPPSCLGAHVGPHCRAVSSRGSGRCRRLGRHSTLHRVWRSVKGEIGNTAWMDAPSLADSRARPPAGRRALRAPRRRLGAPSRDARRLPTLVGCKL